MVTCKNGHEYTQENTWLNKRGRKCCRICRNENAKKFRQRHSEQVTDWHKTNYVTNSARIIEYKRQYRKEGRHKDAKYKLKVPYTKMLQEQNGLCAICGEADEKSLAVDHDHSCCPKGTSCGDCVRELLCRRCNTTLGAVNDSPELLQKLIDYLHKHENLTEQVA